MVVGRKAEIQLMRTCLKQERAQLLAVIGRRRVGKTFLIREVYKENKVFEMTGFKDADLQMQLVNFTLQLNKFFPSETMLEVPADWLSAFNMLTTQLEKTKKKVTPVVFFDELPWIAGKGGGFLEALAHWWNNWASQQKIVAVICGSAASWMIENVVNAKGGLHNRISKRITLEPFTLAETKEYFATKKIALSDYQIVQLYMAIGGVPHYLEQVVKGKSASQNIQDMCFAKDGMLKNEFENLYPALFDNAGNHIKVIKALASKSVGMDRQAILKSTKLSDGGWFSAILNELLISGFISTYSGLNKKTKDTLYRLTDEYSLFYLKFIEGQSKRGEVNWTAISQSQAYKIWCGYAFENICLKHTYSIKKALGISGVQSSDNSFLHKKNKSFEKGFQIDLLIDRKDEVMNMCEMKFYEDEFAINADYAKILRTKKQGLKAVTNTKKTIFTTFVTTYGVFENKNKTDLVDHDLTIDIFFE